MIWNAGAFFAGVMWIETRAALDPVFCYALPLSGAALAMACAFAFRRWPGVRSIAARAAILALGIVWAAWRADLQLASGEADVLKQRDRELTGTVVSIPASGQSIHGSRIQFDFEPDGDEARPAPRKVRVSWYETSATPRAAERWRLLLRMKPPRGFANPGGFDYEGQLFREGVDAVGYVRQSSRNARVSEAGWRHPVLQVRAAVVERMRRVLADSSARGVAIGLAVGATDEIDTEQWRVFQATGITHLIAISGLHVTMIAALGMLLVRLLWRLPWQPRPRHCRADVAAFVGALMAAGYALLAGFSVPTQRTLIMFLAALLALWLRRNQPPSHILSAALIAVLLFDPHAALAPGFWLSFLCVAAILWAAHGQRKRGGILGGIREFFTVQGAVTVALLPATLLWFGSISVVAPLVNIAAIPYFGFVLVPAILFGLGLMSVAPAAGEWVLRMAAASFERFWPLLERAAQVPGAFVHLPQPSLLLTIALAFTAVVMISPLPWRVRALGAAVLLPLFCTAPPRPVPGGVQVTVLDVGQGLSVFVRTHNHALLYDTGPSFRSGRSAGDLAVAPFLWHEGIRRLDMLVVSHPDDDHAGGVPAVMKAVDVADVRYTAEAPPLPTQWGGILRACARGESWTWDGVHFEFIHPQRGERWKHNDGSCVLRIGSPGGSVLLTGDIQREAESHLIRQGRIARADIVVVPHHGSRTSSTPAFVAATRPAYAVMSAGFLNRWGFPMPDVVERWCRAGAELPGTAEWGAVTLDIDPQQGVGRPRAYRREYRRYWHAPAMAAGRSLCLL